MFNKNEFNAQLARRGVKKNELAKVLGIEYTTLYRKVEENGKFTREEMAKIIDYLGIEDPVSIFLPTKLRNKKRRCKWDLKKNMFTS